jgi:hypothetical protein
MFDEVGQLSCSHRVSGEDVLRETRPEDKTTFLSVRMKGSADQVPYNSV